MLRAGLIGFPSTGKTTLFQLMTRAADGARLRGHGRSDPHIGVSRVPDDRLDRLTALFKPRRQVAATVEFADPGGAAGGQGADALLDVTAFRNADALVHVVRGFRNEMIPRAEGSTAPARDARTIEDELILTDLGLVERRLERIARDLRKSGAPDLRAEQAVLERCRAALESGRPIRALEVDGGESRLLRGFQLLSAKPLLLVLNVDETELGDLDGAADAAGLSALTARHGVHAVAVCARIELEIAQLEPADAAAFMADLGLHESGLNRVIRATYELLGYISFFTVGEDECRAWSIPRGTAASVAAGEIHSDIARGFIRAEVVRWDLLLARGSLAGCREHGELRLEGKDYVVRDGDVINFRFAT